MLLFVAACGETARHPVTAGMGPSPLLPKPVRTSIPTVNLAVAKRWDGDRAPKPADGLRVQAFARGLDHPRWLHVLPNGDVLVAETNAPERPEDAKGIKGWFFKQYQKKAGGAVPSADRITLLRDVDGDGVADRRWVLLDSLHSPFGMALVGGTLYVANTDAIVRAPYAEGDTVITSAPTTLAALPGGPLNHHWTKGLIASRDGARLYAAVGSNSNAAENGIDEEEGRAAIWEVDIATGDRRIFASGLRNPVGMAWVPSGDSAVLWTSVNERDELGSDLVPDYMTSVRRDGFYGWPYSYYGDHVDERVQPPRPDLVERAIVPDYALGPHTASLGLAFADRTALPAPFTRGMFVGQHGSWNRDPYSGYRVIFVPFTGDRPVGDAIEVLTGFRDDDETYGRPVGVAMDAAGALLVADDVGNVIWRVSARR